MSQPLNGLKVLDITQVMAGPFCSMLLCDMGADVIKIESPEGDPTRRFAGAKNDDSEAFNAVNRGKRGIIVNLRTPEGANVVTRLSESADVLIENYRPGVMARFGLDYETLRRVNSRLVYASISGYGQTGPASSKGGFDLIAQGISGVMSVTGEPGGPPAKCGLPLTDLGAGLFALAGIMAALHHRTLGGEGQLVDTSLLEAGVALSVWEATEYLSGRGVPEPLGSAHRMTAPYQAIKCSDGYITLGGATDRTFSSLSQALGHPEWVSDSKFTTNTERVKNRKALADRIEAVTKAQTRSHWIALFDRNDIPCGPINSYAETFTDAQVLSRNMVVETHHPTLGLLRTLGTPVKLSETPLRTGRPAPLRGEHTSQVLKEMGYTVDEVLELRERGAIA